MMSPRTHPRAIVLDVAHPRAVAVVRSLARAGIEVWGVDHRREATGFYSKYLSRRFLLDDARYAAELLALLGSIAADGRGAFLMPTADRSNVFVASHREELIRLNFSLHTVPWRELEVCMDREACYDLARELGIGTPESYAPKNADELEQVLATLEFGAADYVLKTRVWDAVADLRTRRHVLVPAQDADSLRRHWHEITQRSKLPATIERIVPGESEDCVGISLVMDRDFKPAVAYGIRRLRMYNYARGGRYRHPYEMGSNVYCESVHDDEALAAALALVRRIGYFGAITVEFRRNSQTGELVLIKLDPRVVRATALSTRLGQDVPLALYRHFALGERVTRCEYRDGVRWMWVSQYVGALRQHASWRSLVAEVFALFKILTRVRAFAYLSLRDPLPFWKSMTGHVPFARRGLREWLKRRAALPESLEQVSDSV